MRECIADMTLHDVCLLPCRSGQSQSWVGLLPLDNQILVPVVPVGR